MASLSRRRPPVLFSRHIPVLSIASLFERHTHALCKGSLCTRHMQGLYKGTHFTRHIPVFCKESLATSYRGHCELIVVIFTSIYTISAYHHLSHFYSCLSRSILGDHHGRDRMVVGFITTYVISAYHN
jgi:hypothetical protein